MHGTFSKTSVILVYVLSCTIKQVTVQPLIFFLAERGGKRGQIRWNQIIFLEQIDLHKRSLNVLIQLDNG